MRRRTKTKVRCAVCGRKFTPNRSDHVYCTKACKTAAWRIKRDQAGVLGAFGIALYMPDWDEKKIRKEMAS